MKLRIFLLLVLCITCIKKKNLTSESILQKSIKNHDPENNFDNLNFKIRVQEPRLQNFVRFSNASLNNKTGVFILERNRDSAISKHIINAIGESTSLLNNKVITDSLLVKKFRLEPLRNNGYKRYYQFFSLLPISLKKEEYTISNTFTDVVFNKKAAYKISIELEKSFFSKHWRLFFSKDDFTFLGLEIFFPNDNKRGERIVFDGKITLNKISLARFHHWYKLDGTYSGSDIIVKELK